MKIYTKTGDKGVTSIYAKTVLKVDKDDVLIECYGTLDELNSQLGLICALLHASNNEAISKWHAAIQACQQQIFTIGFALSDQDKLKQQSIQTLETHIDNMQACLLPQTSFILPGGCIISAQLHIARTIARRAERRLVSASKLHSTNPLALAYINRLSDFLFTMARLCNHACDIEDIKV